MYIRIYFIGCSGEKYVSYKTEMPRNLLFHSLRLPFNYPSFNVFPLNSPGSDGTLKPQDYKNKKLSKITWVKSQLAVKNTIPEASAFVL